MKDAGPKPKKATHFCRCGGGPGDAACRKGPKCAQQYQARLSGPFLDRIDLFFDTPPVTAMDLTLPPPAEGSAEAAARVAEARAMQTERYAGTESPSRRAVNADADSTALDTHAQPDDKGKALIAEAASKLNLSARAYHRVLKVARTIADLDGASAVRRIHIAEALSYRRRVPSDTTAQSEKALAQ
ncbi:MAG: ATP-binding protein [Pseudomonadota bacterium]